MSPRSIGCFIFFCFAGHALCADPGAGQTTGPGDRFWFPKNFVRGFLDFEVAPPHNEVDLGLCAVATRDPSGALPGCRAFARYIWSGYVEFQPIGRGIFRKVFVFAHPKLFGGDNVPQQSYTASGAPILWERTYGIGIELPKQLEFRTTSHSVGLLGRYSGVNGAFTFRPDGPYGLYTTIGLRWYFGGYGRQAAAAVQ